MRRSRAGALLAGLVVIAVPATAGGAPLPSDVSLVGASCSKPLQVYYDKDHPYGSEDEPVAMHPWDDHWISLSVTHVAAANGMRRYDAHWSLSPEVKLCDTGWTAFGTRRSITTRTGARSSEIRADTPAKAKVNARFGRKIAMRDGLDRRRVKVLVAGWVSRSCALRSSNRPAAELLDDLANRAGANGCRPPKRERANAAQLLDHLTAYFNAQGVHGSTRMAQEYYRVLGQLTTY